jgi:23S rRNA (pseudouridine1915-N3)-methyltransferase
MKITLIAVGAKMPRWVTEAYTEYVKRLPPEFSMRLVEIPAYKRTIKADIKRLILKEGEQVCAAIPRDDYIIALTERGRLWNTQELAVQLSMWRQMRQNLSLLIGGPEGLAQECLDKAHFQWSLSPLTWPHPLVRVMIAEQIYRAWTIVANHPYHR